MNIIPSGYSPELPAPRGARERSAGIPESHIADIWLREAVPGRAFVTAGGERIILRSAGIPNRSDGPDFEQAVIVRGGRELTGAIEIHRSERDWERHGHHRNPRYGGVILHVVLAGRFDGRKVLPGERLTLFLADNLRGSVSNAWEKTRANLSARERGPMPEEACSAAPERARRAMIALAAAERFIRKRRRIEARRKELAASCREGEAVARRLLFEFVAEALGYGANKAPMRSVAAAFPPAFWASAGSLSFFERGTLLLGAADQLGPLCMRLSAHSVLLVRSAWERLRCRLCPLPESSPAWNQGGMRPGNAPHNRLLTLAAIIPRFLDPAFLPALREGCRRFPADPPAGLRFFERMLAPREEAFLPDYGAPVPGTERLHEIVVNILAPFLHQEGCRTGDGEMAAGAARMYFSAPSAARNRLVEETARRLSIPSPGCSGDQQGLLEIRREYCEKLRCGECLACIGI